MMSHGRNGWMFVVALLAVCRCAWSGPLAKDEILLLVNSKVPESRQLADFYRVARDIPEGRILELDLPFSEELPFAHYERQVIPAVREFLRKNKLESKIRCIVTFYGVPIRISAPQAGPEERVELEDLGRQRKVLLDEIDAIVRELEMDARAFQPSFKPGGGREPDEYSRRADAAMKVLAQRTARAPDQATHDRYARQMIDAVKKLAGPAGMLRLLGSAQNGAQTRAAMESMAEDIRRVSGELAQLQEKRFDAKSRAQARKLVAECFGKIELARLVEAQADYLGPTNAVAAFDNELALLWWNTYRRSMWQGNPLHYGVREAHPPVMMVTRLDAPQAGLVRDIILTSLKAERDGLKGKVVLDTRGIMPKADEKVGGYGWYDQTIRNLGQIIRTQTKLPMLLDDSPTVLPAGSATDVAIYCGWYSVRSYVPACKFNPGAVAFHIASFEMVSLRNPGEKGWVAGLLNDGVAATLGPVAEPYLGAFPQADDFFALLLTGRLSLAEVYWKTTPATSWMMSIIGDPLYTPFRGNPGLPLESLPARLRPALVGPATAPASQPVR